MKLKFECKTKEERAAAEHFISWLCGQGEQDYWQWMETREGEEDGNITITNFKYDYKNNSAECELGRLEE